MMMMEAALGGGPMMAALVLLLLFSTTATANNAKDNCTEAAAGPAPVVVNQDADIYLGRTVIICAFLLFLIFLSLSFYLMAIFTTGVLLNVREMDDETPGKCGTALHREAVELYEALRWYLSFINQKSGQVAARLVKDSLIPGVKLG